MDLLKNKFNDLVILRNGHPVNKIAQFVFGALEALNVNYHINIYILILNMTYKKKFHKNLSTHHFSQRVYILQSNYFPHTGMNTINYSDGGFPMTICVYVTLNVKNIIAQKKKIVGNSYTVINYIYENTYNKKNKMYLYTYRKINLDIEIGKLKDENSYMEITLHLKI